jgi:uncharacterized protein (TIGR02594 family)
MSDMKRYPHVFAGGAPSLVREAAKLHGTIEFPGARNNPVIMGWAREVEKALRTRDLAFRTLGYTSDGIPWCGLLAGVVAVRAGWSDQMPMAPLWARNFLHFGERAPVPMFGDVLVFSRSGGGGHVGFYVGEDASAYHVLGGNQRDAVNIVRIAKNRLLGARRPKWRIAQPASVRKIIMGAEGPLSTNEA